MVFKSGIGDLAGVYMQIVHQPDIFLREPTSEVKFPLNLNDQIIIDQMIDTMYRNNGIGLAANQVGYNRRIFVMDTSTEHNSPLIFINPIIKNKAKAKLTEEEGCLSCPTKIVEVRRPIYAGLKYFCRHGEEQYKTFYHLPARVVQHEIDHLEGKLITDRP
jgi:peptide deformylase